MKDMIGWMSPLFTVLEQLVVDGAEFHYQEFKNVQFQTIHFANSV